MSPTSRTSALLAMLLLCTASLAAGRKLRAGVSTRVFNGTAADRAASNDLSFVVAFYFTPATQEEADAMTPFCTGTLITSNVVLTAAHCFFRNGTFYKSVQAVDTVSVRIEGEWDRIIPLSAIQVHPSFVYASVEETLGNGSTVVPFDVAVVQLSEDATTTPAAGPVPTSYPLSDAQELLVAGYGDTDQTVLGDFGGLTTTNTMHYATVNYLGDRCPTRWEGTICAGGYANTCQGDSGGPLLTQGPDGLWYVLGVTSYGPYCGRNAAQGKDEYGHYSDVRTFKKDIETMIGLLLGLSPSPDASPSASPSPSPSPSF